MLSGLFGMFLPSYLVTVVYMLQSTEYMPNAYLAWYWRTSNFNEVAKRRAINLTTAARALLLFTRIGALLQVIIGLSLLAAGYINHEAALYWFGGATLLSYPILWAHLVILPVALGRVLVVKPKQHKLISNTSKILADHRATKIAVAGSYGKTSMKELLLTVLSEGKKVGATPANKNVASSHAVFAHKLDGDEDVLVIEYGEGKSGDIARFAHTTHPDIGIITGLAPAHLNQYPTLEAAGKDIFSLAEYLKDQNVYVNSASSATKPFIKSEHHTYNDHSVLGWQISNIKVGYEGTSFEMKKGGKHLKLHSKLLGRHQVGPLALVAALASSLGLTDKQIIDGIAKTAPYEHRMQPRHISDAWVIDDTYNGNIEGIRAGLELMKELKANHKMYVTPGLVDQGIETKNVHLLLGKLIAQANPDKVVLMNNSVTKLILQGLKDFDYKGEIRVENDPLSFYKNIDQFLASGDLVVMQNDWTDNYN